MSEKIKGIVITMINVCVAAFVITIVNDIAGNNVVSDINKEYFDFKGCY